MLCRVRKKGLESKWARRAMKEVFLTGVRKGTGSSPPLRSHLGGGWCVKGGGEKSVGGTEFPLLGKHQEPDKPPQKKKKNGKSK